MLPPHFFTKEPVPTITHLDLLKTIDTVKNCKTVEDAMQLALDILSKKYESKRFATYIFFFQLFEKDPNKLWQRTGFLHCTQQNFLFRILLIKSGWLKDDQIELRFSFVWYISPHQFLKVKLKEKTIAIDPWNYDLGAKFGQYASGFGFRSL